MVIIIIIRKNKTHSQTDVHQGIKITSLGTSRRRYHHYRYYSIITSLYLLINKVFSFRKFLLIIILRAEVRVGIFHPAIFFLLFFFRFFSSLIFYHHKDHLIPDTGY